MLFSIDRRGTRRLTICIGPWALKFARGVNGRECNRFEANVWKAEAETRRRDILCPILARLPFDVCLIMRRATPITEEECKSLRETRGFPEWDYLPGGLDCPFEPKASDWGRLPDGSLVALDYSVQALD